MNDEIQVRQLFSELLTAIEEKDADKFHEMSDDSLAVRHVMTGTAQSGSDFISDVLNEKFAIYSFADAGIDLRVIGGSAFVIGRFTADSRIYGMERSERRICMKLTLRKCADGWKYTEIRVSGSDEI